MYDGTLKPIDPEHLHADVRAALENLQRLQGEVKAASEAHEAAKQALRQAEDLDIDHQARQQVAGDKPTRSGHASKAQATLDGHKLSLAAKGRAIEIAEGDVLAAVAEHIGEMREQLNQQIEVEHDAVSEGIEDIIPRVERVAAVVASRNWIERPTREPIAPELRGCPPIPQPPGYSKLVSVLQAALQPVGAAENASPYDTFRETMRLAEEAQQLVKNGQAEWPADRRLLSRAEDPRRTLADTRELRDEFRAIIDRARRHTQAQEPAEVEA